MKRSPLVVSLQHGGSNDRDVVSVERQLHIPVSSNSNNSNKTNRWKHVWMYLMVLAVTGCLWIVSITLYTILKIYPEIGMVVQSQCKNRYRDWDGKFWKLQVGKNFVAARPRPRYSYVKENVGTLSHDRRRSLRGISDITMYSTPSSAAVAATAVTNHNSENVRPLILWGTHHKAGTFVAQKIFSLICAQMQWCCSFHVTRESIYAMKDALIADSVQVLGHTQWIWHPRELGVPYKFIHFYRHPLKKIISGYRYHRDGAEVWTTKQKQYGDICLGSLPLFSTNRRTNFSTAILASRNSNNSRGGKGNIIVNGLSSHSTPSQYRNSIARSTVVDYCRSIHLCETCCRREHEAQTNMLFTNASHVPSIGKPRSYVVREEAEYAFLCHNLGQLVGTSSLVAALVSRTVGEGLAVEAALEYYENLRMARVYNATINDPNTLHVDVDELADNYSAIMKRILHHMQLSSDTSMPPAMHDQMLEDLEFYNLETSWIYRLGMNNLNHIGYKRTNYQNALMTWLKSNKEVMALYAPILELMPMFNT